MKSKIGLAMWSAALSVAIIGCGSSADNGGSAESVTKKGKDLSGALKGKDLKHLVVGFSQIGAESGWRKANTESILNEAKKLGIDLKFADAQQKQENQIKALRSFIAQKVDVIMFSPVVEAGWKPVMKEINDAGIPVIIADRRPDADESYYLTFIGSEFTEEGRKAAQWLAKKMNGQANIAELQGTTGSAPATDRKKGFEEILKQNSGMKIIMTQSGEFTRAKGKQVMEAFLKSPDGDKINALFAHNDDMALGAIQAIEAAGKKPGKDIVIVSVDGVHDAFQAMLDGKLNCSVECNPIIGPQLFEAIAKLTRGEKLPKRTVVKEDVYDQSAVTPAVLQKRLY